MRSVGGVRVGVGGGEMGVGGVGDVGGLGGVGGRRQRIEQTYPGTFLRFATACARSR